MAAEATLGSKGRGHRAFTIDGFEVLVGKGDAENDALTFDVADPHDFWLHVAGPAGSHVVVRNPDKLSELPRPVLEAAASLAAWHSKARGSRGKVEVHVCRVADVSKPRGFAPGEVQLRRWSAVKVYARDIGGAL
jgi:predicted ribosome quality control (RQC) complex YloA/Tae2 family protein